MDENYDENCMIPVHVQSVGDSRFTRYILRDELGQYWTGYGWTDEPGGAALYYRENDVLEAHNHYRFGDAT